MSLGEFEFIQKYFSHPLLKLDVNPNIVLNVGDDAAVLNLQGLTAITTDSLIEKVHFFSDEDPFLLGKRTLEVNFSDIYAMGMHPHFVTLSLNIPELKFNDEHFWTEFSRGFFECLEQHKAYLVGGNLSKMPTFAVVVKKTKAAMGNLENNTLNQDNFFMPLVMDVTVLGQATNGSHMLCRNLAKEQDFIVVTGDLGLNGLYVQSRYDQTFDYLEPKLQQSLRVQAMSYQPCMGIFVDQLVPLCSCAIDVSDGLLGDLSHILKQSQLQAKIEYTKLPKSPLLLEVAEKLHLSSEQVLKLALTAGGDYNLLFTMSQDNFALLQKKCQQVPSLQGFKFTVIGHTESLPKSSYDKQEKHEMLKLSVDQSLISLVDDNQQVLSNNVLGIEQISFNHFA